MIELKSFINKYVIKRNQSMFEADIADKTDNLFKSIGGKSVIVIGGAGSIGSSFIRAVLSFDPAELFIIDTNENALTELTRDLRSGNYKVPEIYVSYPMDYASSTFQKMFKAHGRFDIVANFSAHKHVRSEKDIYSIEAMLRNNVINAKGLLDLLTDYPPNVYFCVSTDKAANPVNIMGASKRIMEDLIFSYSGFFAVKTARFANVAFSNGSLPDGFLQRISKLQPLSGPSDVRRFFVSPEESGQICMLAAMLGGNREIFFPKLDEVQMQTFDEIGRKLLREYGYDVLECDSEAEAIKEAEALRNGSNRYPVFFSKSDTSGEKAYEEFYTEEESLDLSRYTSLGVIVDKPIPDNARLDKLINDLDGAFSENDCTKEDIVKLLKDYLPEFEHIETGKSLDGKM